MDSAIDATADGTKYAGKLLAANSYVIPKGTLAMAQTHKVSDTLTLTRDAAAPSLAGTGTLYAVAQVRLVDPQRVRFQCAGSEWTYMVPSDIAAWLSAQPAPWKSAAGTGAVYVPCLIRPEGDASMRVQVPGASLNRDWGAEWIHSGPCPKSAAGVILAAMTLASEDTTGVLLAEGKPAKPAPEPEPEPEDDDDDEDEDEDN